MHCTLGESRRDLVKSGEKFEFLKKKSSKANQNRRRSNDNGMLNFNVSKDYSFDTTLDVFFSA